MSKKEQLIQTAHACIRAKKKLGIRVKDSTDQENIVMFNRKEIMNLINVMRIYNNQLEAKASKILDFWVEKAV